MTQVDLNPFSLGKLAPASGTPLSLLSNYSDLAYQSAKEVTVFALASNTGSVYVGSATLNRSTLAGVLLILAPGETKVLPFDQEGGNRLNLNSFYVDVDTTGDAALPIALFA